MSYSTFSTRQNDNKENKEDNKEEGVNNNKNIMC